MCIFIEPLHKPLQSATFPVGTDGLTTKLGSRIINHGMDFQNVNHNIRKARTGKVGWEKGGNRSENCILIERASSPRPCGLARARSLGPQRAFRYAEFLSPVPNRLKSPSSVMEEREPRERSRACINRYKPLQAATSRYKPLQSATFPVGTDGLTTKLGSRIINHGMDFQNVNHNIRKARTGKVGWEKGGNRSENCILIERASSPRPCGLARARSLGPQRAFRYAEFLSPVPNRLKSPSSVMEEREPRERSRACINRYKPLQAATKRYIFPLVVRGSSMPRGKSDWEETSFRTNAPPLP